MKDKIRADIEESGRHVACVSGGQSPRYLYTIGLSAKVGFELVFAGQAQIPNQVATSILHSIAKELESGKSVKKLRVDNRKFGSFTLSEAQPTWSRRMLSEVAIYYEGKDIRAMQVLPEPERATIDIPPMEEVFDPGRHRVWQWLDGNWPYEISAQAQVVSNLEALQGYAVSELVRWEDSEGQMFSGPGAEGADDELVNLPLATLLGFDKSLEAALNLEIQSGLYREFDEQGQEGPWQPWKCLL